ncbi:hypothetical protein FOXG_15903, partial [Fusarium oxysporum f. sp. lycopersici 4287]
IKFSAVSALLLPLSGILALTIIDSGPISIITDKHATETKPLSIN